jgi:hypothetical protein
MMQLFSFEQMIESAGVLDVETREDVGEGVRQAYLKRMHELISRADSHARLEVWVEVEGMPAVFMYYRRRDTAAAMIFFDNPFNEPVAVGAFLRGVNGGDDAGAVDLLRNYEPQLPFATHHWNALIAHKRPCVGVLYSDQEWFRNSVPHVSAMAAAVAMSHPP